MTPTQLQTIERIKEEAARSFNESSVYRESCELTFEAKESDTTSLAFLTIYKKAKENTGLLFLDDTTVVICLGARGGIKNARYISSLCKISDTVATRRIRKGYISF